MITKTRYEHDCVDCIYLGPSGRYDLYACTINGVVGTVIARSGEDGEYTSGLAFAKPGTVLGEALNRAEALGLKTI